MNLDLKVIGAGMGRTGTTSLQEALSFLLDGPCFHMLEYRSRPELVAIEFAQPEDPFGFVAAVPTRLLDRFPEYGLEGEPGWVPLRWARAHSGIPIRFS